MNVHKMFYMITSNFGWFQRFYNVISAQKGSISINIFKCI
jgi:hypothetical protein